jgi:hypothetical protein
MLSIGHQRHVQIGTLRADTESGRCGGRGSEYPGQGVWDFARDSAEDARGRDAARPSATEGGQRA